MEKVYIVNNQWSDLCTTEVMNDILRVYTNLDDAVKHLKGLYRTHLEDYEKHYGDDFSINKTRISFKLHHSYNVFFKAEIIERYLN